MKRRPARQACGGKGRELKSVKCGSAMNAHGLQIRRLSGPKGRRDVATSEAKRNSWSAFPMQIAPAGARDTVIRGASIRHLPKRVNARMRARKRASARTPFPTLRAVGIRLPDGSPQSSPCAFVNPSAPSISCNFSMCTHGCLAPTFASTGSRSASLSVAVAPFSAPLRSMQRQRY